MCATAQAYLDAGDPDRAEALYNSVPPVGPKSCAVRGLNLVDQQRVLAANEVAEGRRSLRAGHLDTAEESFHSALCADGANKDAIAGLAQIVALRGHSLPTASSNWDYFYGDWVRPVGKLLLPIAIGIAVLLAAASLASHWLVRPESVAWSKSRRGLMGGIGILLLAHSAVMLPVYPMFQPYDPGSTLLLTALLLAIALTLTVWVLTVLSARAITADKGNWRDVMADWRALLVSLPIVLGLGLALGLTALHGSDDHQILVAYGVLTVFGVLLTGAALGQLRRLQVVVQDHSGTTEVASTDYLLARMQSLGEETPLHLVATSALTPLSKLSSGDLSTLPTGRVVGALARVFFALRPDLTWRATVSVVDCNRVAVTITRNGRHASSEIISRPELGLLPIPTAGVDAEVKAAQERAKAQLITGAAACVLMRLSEVHHELKENLYGADNWRSITQQVIATSKSLIDHEEQQVPLLGQALNDDPGYLLARFEYLWAIFRHTPAEDRNHRQFALTVDRHLRTAPHDLKLLMGWPFLNIRILYSSATQWLNAYLHSGLTDTEALREARTSVGQLLRNCYTDSSRPPELGMLKERMRPFADNLQYCLMVLDGNLPLAPEAAHPHELDPLSPRLALHHACLDSFLLIHTNNRDWESKAVEDLRYALATPVDRTDALADPCLQQLKENAGFRNLVGLPPRSFLDLAVLANYRAKLLHENITTSRHLELRTATPALCKALATQLQITLTEAERLRDLAELAQFDQDLKHPGALHLLHAINVDSREDLNELAQRDPKELIRSLRRAATEANLSALPAVRTPWRWLYKIGVDPARVRDAQDADRPPNSLG
ncbi:DUF4332 domain-containing protein [Kitasatospora azatica]|uniref:DUF4332 domain-containing protein n=1 Tax=Kitasatospora azatica TaxID=58347 RepID=UPI0018DCE28D|nr:DUF4332 domain-containing protein [Kitasatospora azatica]